MILTTHNSCLKESFDCKVFGLLIQTLLCSSEKPLFPQLVETGISQWIDLNTPWYHLLSQPHRNINADLP